MEEKEAVFFFTNSHLPPLPLARPVQYTSICPSILVTDLTLNNQLVGWNNKNQSLSVTHSRQATWKASYFKNQGKNYIVILSWDFTGEGNGVYTVNNI